MENPTKSILILDFGSQYTQLIARRIRELHIHSSIVSFDISPEKLKPMSPAGLILSGGPSSVYKGDAPGCDHELFNLGIPILGICYGLQLMVFNLGGEVDSDQKREFGYAELEITEASPIFHNLPHKLKVWMSHGDKVKKLPKGFNPIAQTANTDFAGISDRDRKFYGLQFHPEVVHTDFGTEILHNFCRVICECPANWTMDAFIETNLAETRARVNGSKVILGLSGGIDSAVAAVLLRKAIEDQLICVFVDNGLLRSGEAHKVREVFGQRFGENFHFVDASDQFVQKLAGVIDPETKRKIIGREFIEVFDKVARNFADVKFLGQGTTYPDVIESVPIDGNPSAMIKSHHNVGGLPERMRLELVEPVRNLFKDEVREVGRQLGLPEEIIMRQPFPGPGLAIRIIGEVTDNRLRTLRQADQIVLEEMKSADYYRKVWQSFAVLLPVQSVGVMGDERTYENVVALRIVESVDGMTADWTRLPFDLLAKISNRIINEVRGVNRVCYDISSKPPGTIEWE
jgi:GMP synthase (glutamine-hydrolysing)